MGWTDGELEETYNTPLHRLGEQQVNYSFQISVSPFWITSATTNFFKVLVASHTLNTGMLSMSIPRELFQTVVVGMEMLSDDSLIIYMYDHIHVLYKYNVAISCYFEIRIEESIYI